MIARAVALASVAAFILGIAFLCVSSRRRREGWRALVRISFLAAIAGATAAALIAPR